MLFGGLCFSCVLHTGDFANASLYFWCCCWLCVFHYHYIYRFGHVRCGRLMCPCPWINILLVAYAHNVTSSNVCYYYHCIYTSLYTYADACIRSSTTFSNRWTDRQTEVDPNSKEITSITLHILRKVVYKSATAEAARSHGHWHESAVCFVSWIGTLCHGNGYKYVGKKHIHKYTHAH